MKNEKVCAMFHMFSIEEGFGMCSVCDKALSLGGHEIFWQLLMETEFIRQLTTQTQADPVVTASPCSFRNLSFVEENAVHYTACSKARAKLLKTDYPRSNRMYCSSEGNGWETEDIWHNHV